MNGNFSDKNHCFDGQYDLCENAPSHRRVEKIDDLTAWNYKLTL